MLELITCHQGMNESIESVTWLNHLGSFTFLAMLSGLEFWRAAEILHPAVVGDACHPFHHKQGGHWKKAFGHPEFSLSRWHVESI